MIAAVALGIFAAFAGASDPQLDIVVPPAVDANTLRWHADFDAAMAESSRRQCPIWVLVSNDQSTGFVKMWKSVFSTPEFAEMAQKAVLLIAFTGDSLGTETREIDGKSVEWCQRFQVPVEARAQVHRRVTGVYVREVFLNPLQLVLDPIGREIGRVQAVISLETMQEALNAAQAKEIRGEPMAYRDYRDAMAKVADLVSSREKKGHTRVFAEFEKLNRKQLAENDAFQDYLAFLRRRMMAEGDAWFAEAQTLFASDDEAERKQAAKLLKKIQKCFRGEEIASKAKELSKSRTP